MINPLTLLNCDSPALAKIMMDYVKTQLNVRLDYRLMVGADPQIPADGLPDYLTFLRNVARTVRFPTVHGYIDMPLSRRQYTSLLCWRQVFTALIGMWLS